MGNPSRNREGRFWNGLGPGTGGVPNPPPRATVAPGGKPRSQIPDRSGRPSGVLKAGAARFSLPSGVLGAPAVWNEDHCATSAEGRIANPSAASFVDVVMPDTLPHSR